MLAVQSAAMSDLLAAGALAADAGAAQAALCLAGAGRKRTAAGGDGDDECKRARPDAADSPAVSESATGAVEGAGAGAEEGTKDTEADATATALAAASAAAAAATAGLAAASSSVAHVASGPLTVKGGVQSLLAECYASGACRPGELDDRVLQGLAALREADGISALGEFMRSDMSKIRNKSAYFSGVISRFKEETGGSGGRHGALKSPVTGNGVHAYGANASAFGGGAHFGSHFGASSAHAAANASQSQTLAQQAAANYAAVSAAAAAATASAQQQQQHANMLMAQAAAHQQHAHQQQQQLLLLSGGALAGGLPRVGVHSPFGVTGYGAVGAQGVAPLAAPQPPGNTATLPIGVQTTLEQLYLRGVQRWELDQKCVENLAIEALQDFSCRDLTTIRNKSAYLMGCLNKRRDAMGAWAEFSKLREADALGCLNEFMVSDMTRIRNKAAYFMGICKKHLNLSVPH